MQLKRLAQYQVKDVGLVVAAVANNNDIVSIISKLPIMIFGKTVMLL